MIPTAIRNELEAHARAEEPNEACGLVALKGGTAERYSGTAGDYLVNASGDFSLTSLRVSQVPEPGMAGLALVGLLAAFGWRRRSPGAGKRASV